jgi:hypothetical protein
MASSDKDGLRVPRFIFPALVRLPSIDEEIVMIRMEQPSFVFNAHDIDPPRYEMWRTIKGNSGTTPAKLVGAIFAANTDALRAEGTPLRNIIINTHGYAGGLHIGGMEKRDAMEKADLAVFGVLRGLNVGPIWLTSCGAARDTTGAALCQTLAKIAGTRVIASDTDQIVSPGQAVALVMAWRWNIDDFEGTVYDFTPNGVARKGIDPENDPMIMSVREWG